MTKRESLFIALAAILAVMWIAGRCRPAPNPALSPETQAIIAKLKSDSISSAQRERTYRDSLALLQQQEESALIAAINAEKRAGVAKSQSVAAGRRADSAVASLARVTKIEDSLSTMMVAYTERTEETVGLRRSLTAVDSTLALERVARLAADERAGLWEVQAGQFRGERDSYKDLSARLEADLVKAKRGCRISLLVASVRCPSTIESMGIGAAGALIAVLAVR